MIGGSVDIKGLHKAFGQTSVLKGIDLTIPSGSVAAILGASGSGKTSLLRIVAGFDRPDAGSIAIGTKVVSSLQTSVRIEDRRIGYVSQEGSLFPHLDVRANVGFGLSRRDRRGSAVDHLLAAVGLEGFARRYPHQLSGGQQQRVALARALATEPQVVLLDEPFSSLDTNMRASVREEVCAILRRSGATAILVTHDQDEALSTADFVAVLRDGTIGQVGTPHELYDLPIDADLATFVGDANIIVGKANGAQVETALGTFDLFRPIQGSTNGALEVLIRPEQIEVTSHDLLTPEMMARVISVDFHGHDTTLRLSPDSRELPSILIARVRGHISAEPGTQVRIAAKGPHHAWPAREAKK